MSVGNRRPHSLGREGGAGCASEGGRGSLRITEVLEWKVTE